MNKPVAIALIALMVLPACSSLPSWMGGRKPVIVKLPGERAVALPAQSEAKPDGTLATVAVKLPPVSSNADWPQRGGLFAATTSNLAGGDFDHSNSVSMGEGNAFVHTQVPQPVIGGGLVFVMDGVGKISAHNAANISEKKWSSAGVSEEDEPDLLGGGLAYAQGKLYAVSGRGLVAAFDAATGKTLWRKDMHAPFRAPPKIAGDKLFAVTIDSQFFALSALSGEVLWSHRGINEIAGIMNSVTPALTSDAVIVPYASGELYALSLADGHEIWNESLSGNKQTQAGGVFSGIGGDPLVDGEVVIASATAGSTAVFGLAHGQRVWEKPISSINTPWVAGDYLFLLSSDNTLICFVKYDGRIQWSMRLPSYRDEDRKLGAIVWRGPVLVNGKLALTSSQGKLLFVSAEDGKIAVEKSIPDDVYSAPVIAGGRMYLVTKGAELYMLQ